MSSQTFYDLGGFLACGARTSEVHIHSPTSSSLSQGSKLVENLRTSIFLLNSSKKPHHVTLRILNQFLKDLKSLESTDRKDQTAHIIMIEQAIKVQNKNSERGI